MSTPSNADTPTPPEKENLDPKTPAKKVLMKNKPQKSQKEAKIDTTGMTDEPAGKKKSRRAIFSTDDDRVMINELLRQKDEGNATDNGGWKETALQAVVRALIGSENISGGVPKTVRSIRDHYGKLKTDYKNFNTLATQSGWGWDSEAHRAHPTMAKYRNAIFPIYEDMNYLLNGAIATGRDAFHAGRVVLELDDNSSDVAISGPNDGLNDQDKADSDSESEAKKVKSQRTPLKRKFSAREPSSSVKRSCHDYTGRISSAGAISQMSEAIEGMAAALIGTSTSGSNTEQSQLRNAVKLLEKEEDLTTTNKARIKRHV
ncbi:hypothetical protein DFH05DRAFT_1620171 [Lentinula detonsa]|uniref:Myb/SANT-like domain-containing protein n=1 Tax=Lentinula detonsa TaxID=2804962 RepID=A0A9W8NZI0_9AGAR|nr:hypothetical protein DFH05DRAFT_1620171 [Lentinula detonsa]